MSCLSSLVLVCHDSSLDIDRVAQECRVCLVLFWFAMTRRST